MATSKTLAPTNVTISIPEFTDRPDQRVNSNCIDKLGDAVNALNSKITESDIVTIQSGYDTTQIEEVSYVKCGTTCMVNIVVKAGSAVDWHNGVNTGLPLKVRPKGSVYGTHRINTASDLNLRMFSMLNSNGTLQYIPNIVSAASVPICFTYPVEA